MLQVDLKNLLMRLNAYCTNALQGAAGLCVSRGHYEVTVEHFLLKCLADRHADIPLILAQYDIDAGRLEKELGAALEELRTGNTAKPVFSPRLLELMQDAWLLSSVDLQEQSLRSGAILRAFLARPGAFGSGEYVKLLEAISREALMRDFWTIAKGSVEKDTAPVAERGATGEPGEGRPAADSAIGRFCNDFTQKAREGTIDPVFGRDKEIRQMVDILARRRKNNPICVGEPGVGKTAVIEGLALRIIEDDVPDVLKNVRLLELDMGLLEAGAGMKGEFENRLKGVINEIKASEQPVILFIDEAHTLIGSGGSAGKGDAANLLKPALARGELRTVAATTWSEYKKYFEKDPALARRFQPVKLDEPSVANSILILRGIKPHYEKAHTVVVRDDAIEAAASYADRYITGRFLPDKAIDLLDTSCARVKINLSSKPGVLEDKERTVQALERNRDGMERDRLNGAEIDEERYQALVKEIEQARSEADALRETWQRERDAALAVVDLRAQLQAPENRKEKAREELKVKLDQARDALADLQKEQALVQVEVDPDVVAQVVSDWTGIPLGKFLRDEAQTIVALEQRLEERVKGQNHALAAIAQTVKAAKAGVKNPDQPMGVFLLVGPSGTGKTETGLALAELLFGSASHIVTINMSEFQEGHTVSRLIGSPPGYVGYGEGGMLTEAVRQKPYSVVLLDEVEKAHLDVMEAFYQVFDKGTMTDGEGKEINFRNTIVLLTSNLASDVIQEMTADDDTVELETLVGAIRPILSQHFKPALLARMSIVPYRSLRGEAMELIVKLKLGKVARQLQETNGMDMTYTPAVVKQIAGRCTEVETGARNIEYIMNGNILPQLSQRILTHMTDGAMPSAVALDVDDSGAFTMKFAE